MLADGESTAESFTALMDQIETYVKNRGTDHRTMISVFASTTTTAAPGSTSTAAEYMEVEEATPRDSLDLLWLQVSGLIQRDWKEVMLYVDNSVRPSPSSTDQNVVDTRRGETKQPNSVLLKSGG